MRKLGLGPKMGPKLPNMYNLINSGWAPQWGPPGIVYRVFFPKISFIFLLFRECFTNCLFSHIQGVRNRPYTRCFLSPTNYLIQVVFSILFIFLLFPECFIILQGLQSLYSYTGCSEQTVYRVLFYYLQNIFIIQYVLSQNIFFVVYRNVFLTQTGCLYRIQGVISKHFTFFLSFQNIL